MGHKVYVELTVLVVIEMDKKGVKTSDVINKMDHSFSSNTEGAHISDTSIRGSRVIRIETPEKEERL